VDKILRKQIESARLKQRDAGRCLCSMEASAGDCFGSECLCASMPGGCFETPHLHYCEEQPRGDPSWLRRTLIAYFMYA
jgi:hypothetical protein